MVRRKVWTEEKLEAASKMWEAGFSAQKIADHFSTTKGSFSGAIHYRREMFPLRQRDREKKTKVEPKRRKSAPPLPAKKVRSRVHSLGIRSVDRVSRTGEIHSMPFVSILNGGRQECHPYR